MVVMAGPVMLLVTLLVTGSGGMRLEADGGYTGITVSVHKDIPDTNCKELLTNLQVKAQGGMVCVWLVVENAR
jgi:hypothetical protein